MTIVIPLKNEARTISKLCESLDAQTYDAFEVLFVDGGSTDHTIPLIEQFIHNRPNYRLMVIEGANRAKARNVGIAAASTAIIACTDAGVVLDDQWLENLMKPFRDDAIDFVSGVYVGTAENFIQRAIIALQYPKIEHLSETTFLPSSRSIAFKKELWSKIGGYPEHLEKAEDTYLDLKAFELGCPIALAKDAVVYWPPRTSLSSLFSQYSSYAEWDTKAGLLLKVRVYRQLFFAYFLIVMFSVLSFVGGWLYFFILCGIVGSYLILSGLTLYQTTRKFVSFLIGPAVKVTIFLAESAGLLKGFVERSKSS